MYTVGQIAKKFKISRSTLLYYDSIDLLKPKGRSNSNYRLYSDADVVKMERITLYRETGIPLKLIANILENEHNESIPILENRLYAINKEIQDLRTQQNIILKILESENAIQHSRVITKEQWISLMKSVGLDEGNMREWHVQFERMSPEAHQDFLESLGMKKQEVQLIRAISKISTAKSNKANSADAKSRAAD